MNNDNLEFSVLGFNVKFKADSKNGSVSAGDVVEYVHREACKIKEKSPNLSEGQIAILLSLKLASEKLTLEQEYRENISTLQQTATDALQYIEEVSPASP